MLLNTDGYDYTDPKTGEVRHIDTTIDTRDLHWGKYNCSMAVYLESLSMDSGEDDSASNSDIGYYVARFGRWILESDSQGFLTAWKEDSVEDAEAVMARAYAICYDDEDEDEDEEGSE